MRVVSTRVLPVPAPASTSTGPSSVSTACALLRIEPGEIGRARPAGARARGNAAGRGGGGSSGRVCFKGSDKGRNTTDSHWVNMAPGRGFYEMEARTGRPGPLSSRTRKIGLREIGALEQ